MARRNPLVAAGLAATLIFTLAGCFSPSLTAPTSGGTTPSTGESAPATEESASPASSVDPATGLLITGTGYTFNAPEGWTVPESLPRGVDTAAMDPAYDDGFNENVTVPVGPGEVTPDDVESIGAAQLAGMGATEVEVRPRVTIAGQESGHLAYRLLTTTGVPYLVDEYYASHAGRTCIITFSWSETVTQQDREAVAESVLATWTWAD